LKNNTNVLVNEILSNLFTLVPLVRVLKNPKIQMEHSDLIVEPNVTPIYIFYWGFYYNNIFELLEVYPNLTYYAKIYKVINMFANIREYDHKL